MNGNILRIHYTNTLTQTNIRTRISLSDVCLTFIAFNTFKTFTVVIFAYDFASANICVCIK